MKIDDIGRIDDDILIFGGCYSNFDATRSLFAWADHRGIPAQRRIHTGDSVAYCAQPNETLDLLRAQCDHSIAGNCEQQLAQGQLDCGCGFDSGSTCDMLSVAWYGYVSNALAPHHRDWMQGLADWIVFEHFDKRYVVVHGSPNHISEFVWSVDSDAAFAAYFDTIADQIGPVDVICAGHSGIAFERHLPNNRSWYNAGVIGMPPHRGDPSTQFATLCQGRFQIHNLTYDAQAAAQSMTDAGLIQGYQSALISGYWPSEDVLPAALRVFDKG